MRKTRSDNKLLNLPEEQQAQLAEWLLSGVPYHQAQQLVENQFGVRVSLGKFSLFWSAVCASELLRRRARAVNVANEVAQEAERTPGRFDAATIDALKQKAFELSISPNADPKQVKAIFALVLKARDQELKEGDQELSRTKIELELQKYRDAKARIEGEINAAKASGGLTPETLEKIERELKLL
jgi:hypothetical protein